MARLGDVCDILDNKRVPITASNRLAGPYPYYGANGVQDYVADYIFDDELVLLAEDGGNFGSKDKPIAYRVSGKCWVNNHAHVLNPKEGLDVDYLCYSLMFYDVTGLVNGATRQKLTQADMRKMEIPLPPLDEQRKIAAVLDKVSDLIAKRRQQLDKLDTLVKARFVEMFGDTLLNSMEWPECRLDLMAEIVSGITKGRKIKDTELFEVPYMAVSNVKDGYIDWTTVKTIMATQAEINQYRLLPLDVLMTEGGDPDKLGRGAIIYRPPDNCIHQNHIFRVRLNKAVLSPVYLEQYLQQQRAKRYFLGCAKQTTGIASINMKQLSALPILAPPLALQVKYTAFIEQVNQSKISIQKSCEKLEMLKKALMQQYFG